MDLVALDRVAFEPLDRLLGEELVDAVEPVHGGDDRGLVSRAAAGAARAAAADPALAEVVVAAVEPVERGVAPGVGLVEAAGAALGRRPEDEPPALQVGLPRCRVAGIHVVAHQDSPPNTRSSRARAASTRASSAIEAATICGFDRESRREAARVAAPAQGHEPFGDDAALARREHPERLPQCGKGDEELVLVEVGHELVHCGHHALLLGEDLLAGDGEEPREPVAEPVRARRALGGARRVGLGAERPGEAQGRAAQVRRGLLVARDPLRRSGDRCGRRREPGRVAHGVAQRPYGREPAEVGRARSGVQPFGEPQDAVRAGRDHGRVEVAAGGAEQVVVAPQREHRGQCRADRADVSAVVHRRLDGVAEPVGEMGPPAQGGVEQHRGQGVERAVAVERGARGRSGPRRRGWRRARRPR